MSLPFLNTAPGYDEELRNSVFFERGLHATSICGAVGAAVAVAMLQGQDAALRLRGQGLAPADVTAIELGVAKPVLRTIAGHPRPRHGRPPGTTRRSGAPTRSPRRCSAAASACPTRTSPTPPPVTPAV